MEVSIQRQAPPSQGAVWIGLGAPQRARLHWSRKAEGFHVSLALQPSLVARGSGEGDGSLHQAQSGRSWEPSLTRAVTVRHGVEYRLPALGTACPLPEHAASCCLNGSGSPRTRHRTNPKGLCCLVLPPPNPSHLESVFSRLHVSHSLGLKSVRLVYEATGGWVTRPPAPLSVLIHYGHKLSQPQLSDLGSRLLFFHPIFCSCGGWDFSPDSRRWEFKARWGKPYCIGPAANQGFPPVRLTGSDPCPSAPCWA